MGQEVLLEQDMSVLIRQSMEDGNDKGHSEVDIPNDTEVEAFIGMKMEDLGQYTLDPEAHEEQKEQKEREAKAERIATEEKPLVDELGLSRKPDFGV
ncbi:uncharacterized protein BP5553_08020 [Venustampulla echinocandica]|uniref:Uncharacterized protein n=1 Tax=Venustampulla echinocandica TaxID=2656787 RepID=A0A370TFH7_9HELO|nr:uncharacterized protein BP5553_08020 [Venustampulla echinocandica]RDL33652.1 hypothetical protein BP5553_08020 [Venustampulla echinocandica]